MLKSLSLRVRPRVILAMVLLLACLAGWLESQRRLVGKRATFVAQLRATGDGAAYSSYQGRALPLALAYFGAEQVGTVMIAADRPDLAKQASQLFPEAFINVEKDPMMMRANRLVAAANAKLRGRK